MRQRLETIEVRGASEHNLRDVDVSIERGAITVITGVSGSGKSSLAFDTILAEAQRRFFYTLSHYSRQFLDLANRPLVRSVSGLSPAISLAQNETLPSRRATVGTLTDVGELLGVLLARFGHQLCPTHQLPTAAMSREDIATRLIESHRDKTIALTVPIAEAKKGTFKPQLTAFAAKGYLKAYIDGELTALSPVPNLGREERHTIKLIIDYIKIREESRARLLRSLETALVEGQGFGEWFAADQSGALELKNGGVFSTKGGCSHCGFAWPRLDPRYFSANSLGRCESCQGLGVPHADQSPGNDEDQDAESSGAQIPGGDLCPACEGTGIHPKMRGILFNGWSALDLARRPLTQVRDHIMNLLQGAPGQNPAFRRVADELAAILQRLIDVGLGYLSLSRRVRSLSGGEAQRLRLAGILAGRLRGVLYVLDEPSQGLHPSEVDLVLTTLRQLRDAGNTILLVDHDEAVMRGADWIIDLGPGGGAQGGRVVAKFKPSEAGDFANISETARYLGQGASAADLAPSQPSPSRSSSSQWITIEGASLHNLKIDKVRFPKGAFTVVCGISGAGKSSLVLGTLYPNALRATQGSSGRGRIVAKHENIHCRASDGWDDLTQVALVDRKPIAKSSVSMPGSYLDVMGELRDLYANQPEAQVMGLTARHFSLSVDAGRCTECKGRGEISLAMKFLADSRVVCPTCKGQRFKPNILGVKYRDHSMAEVLQLPIASVVDLFRNHAKIVKRLQPAIELGLGYLKLGQPTASLSGGEAQRLKLVPHLFKGISGQRLGQGTLIIMDEPTTGLHFQDVARLTTVLRQLAQAGVTVVAIEHNPDVIAEADWVIEIGPGSADNGGRLVREGAGAGV